MFNKMTEKFNDFINEGKADLSKIKKPKDIIKQIPNLFTISRLILIPFIIGNIISGNMLIAGFISLGASVTDLIDGKIARALNATSNFGANLDAIVDKIFITSVTIPLFFTNPYLMVPIFMDMIIASINGYAHIQGIQTKTSNVGKIKTVFLDSLIVSTFFTQFKIIDTISKLLYFSTVGIQMKTAKEYYNTYLINNDLVKDISPNQITIENNINDEVSNSKDNKLEQSFEKNNELSQLIEFKNIIINYKKTQEKKLEEEKLNITKK